MPLPAIALFLERLRVPGGAVACPDCFGNWGFRAVVSERARLGQGDCPRCRRRGRRIDKTGLVEAVQLFFVSGSYIAESMAPVYQSNQANPDPARFDPTLEADAKLARALTGEVVFDYGPPLWRVGEVALKHEFAEGGEVRERAARAFVGAAPAVVLPIGTRLFRIRKNPKADESIVTPAAFDPPPPEVAREPGRWDDGTLPVLYASDDIELCLHECRIIVSDEIVVATLTATRQLKLLDLTGQIEGGGPTPFEDPNIFARFLSLKRDADWLGYARTVSRAAHAAGFDGIRYTSYYAQAKHDTSALNVALFGRPISEGALSLQSINRLRVDDARYHYVYGPVLYHDSAMQAEIEAFLAAYGEEELSGREASDLAP